MNKPAANPGKIITLRFLAIPALLIVFSLIVTFKMNNYTVLVVNMALINMITAYGLSIMLGMCGQLVFSGVAFMGIGGAVSDFFKNIRRKKHSKNQDSK